MGEINSNKIKGRIISLGLTQRELPDKMGLNRTTVNLKLNNKRPIYLHEVAKLCEILNIRTPKELKEYFNLDFLILSECRVDDTNKSGGGA